jgi:hypothetical protein
LMERVVAARLVAEFATGIGLAAAGGWGLTWLGGSKFSVWPCLQAGC